MGFKYNVTDQEGIHFVTTTVVGWIDAFTRRELADVVIESLAFCQKKKGLIIYAWCLMPNHLHMIVSASEGGRLSGIMRDFKRHTGKKVIETIKGINESRDWMINKFEFAAKIDIKSKDYKFWQTGFHPVFLESSKFIDQKLNYIHRNPVAAGLVTEAAHYAYSSAIDYEGGKGLLDVVLLF